MEVIARVLFTAEPAQHAVDCRHVAAPMGPDVQRLQEHQQPDGPGPALQPQRLRAHNRDV